MGIKRFNNVDGSNGGYAGTYDYDATGAALAIGDMVTKDGDGNKVVRMAAGGIPLGPVEMITYEFNNEVVEGQPYPGNLTGASNVKVIVSDSQNEILVGPVTGTDLVDADVGQNINLDTTAYDSNTGESNAGFSGSTKAATTSLPFKIKEIFEVRGKQYIKATYNRHTNAPNTGGF